MHSLLFRLLIQARVAMLSLRQILQGSVCVASCPQKQLQAHSPQPRAASPDSMPQHRFMQLQACAHLLQETEQQQQQLQAYAPMLPAVAHSRHVQL